jgi:hypothetical protein
LKIASGKLRNNLIGSDRMIFAIKFHHRNLLKQHADSLNLVEK